MKNKDKHIYISVSLYKKGFVPAGVITFNDDLGYAGFSYFSSYIEQDYPPLNPATLNWRDGNQRHFVVSPTNSHMLDRTFWELLPGDNDWANQILVSRYPEYANMNNAQKLYFLGSRTVGGLSSYVKEKNLEENIDSLEWLDKVREESIDLYLHNIEKISYIKAINPMTSYGGLRPKCMFEDQDGVFWIAKFNLPTDPYDMAKAEHIAMQMSKDVGLRTAESKVIELPSGQNVFLSKRFDRENEHRYHSLSLFAIAPGNELKKNPFAPGNPGGFIQTLVRRYSDFANMDTINILTKLLLDIAVNNTDNHLRNLRIILNRDHKWELAPIYDVVFNPYSNAHTYNPAGLPLKELFLENPQLAQAMSKELSMKLHVVEAQLEKIKIIANSWENYCDKNNVSDEDKSKIGNAVSLGIYRKNYEAKVSTENKVKLEMPKPKPNNG